MICYHSPIVPTMNVDVIPSGWSGWVRGAIGLTVLMGFVALVYFELSYTISETKKTPHAVLPRQQSLRHYTLPPYNASIIHKIDHIDGSIVFPAAEKQTGFPIMLPLDTSVTATSRFDTVPVTYNESPPAPTDSICPLKRTLDSVKPHIRLAIVITSGTSHRTRRDSIRATWLQALAGRSVVYKFFTDATHYMTPADTMIWDAEQSQHGDVVHACTKPGLRHTEIFLYSIAWFLQRYDFDYVLKVDDDMILCIANLLHELSVRCEPYLYWGKYHCGCAHCYTSRMDAFFTLLGRDTVDYIFARPDRILCSPFLDQVVPKWFWEIIGADNVTMFDDKRIVQFRKEWLPHIGANFCDKFIAVHQVYGEDYKTMWTPIADNEISLMPRHFSRVDVQFKCTSVKKLSTYMFEKKWQTTPVRCFGPMPWPLKYNSGIENQEYKGDEEYVMQQ